jgi:hypothetical protein
MFLKNYLDTKKSITMEYVDNKLMLNGNLVEECANCKIYQDNYKGFPIIYRVWKDGTIQFKITEDLINSGLVKVKGTMPITDNDWRSL